MPYTIARGDIGSRPREIARDVLASSSTVDDYIFFRDGHYAYKLIVAEFTNSEIDFDNLTYTNCTIYSLSEVYETGPDIYGMYYEFHKIGTLQSGSVTNPYGVLYYSSNPMTPTLIDRGGVYIETACFIGLCVLTLYILIRDLFSSILRR